MLFVVTLKTCMQCTIFRFYKLLFHDTYIPFLHAVHFSSCAITYPKDVEVTCMRGRYRRTTRRSRWARRRWALLLVWYKWSTIALCYCDNDNMHIVVPTHLHYTIYLQSTQVSCYKSSNQMKAVLTILSPFQQRSTCCCTCLCMVQSPL